jgi:hypothetical protein
MTRAAASNRSKTKGNSAESRAAKSAGSSADSFNPASEIFGAALAQDYAFGTKRRAVA